jgi:hypothetical protein
MQQKADLLCYSSSIRFISAKINDIGVMGLVGRYRCYYVIARACKK